MSLDSYLILISFIAGAIPAAILFVMHSRNWRLWKHDDTGRAMFYLFLVLTGTYVLSVMTLLFPDWFTGTVGIWFRFFTRLGFALVLWNLFRIFMKAQASRREDARTGSEE